MKKSLTLLLAGLLATVPLTGCVSLKSTDPVTGEVTIDEKKLEQTAALIQTTVANGLIIAIDQSPDEAAAIKTYANVAKETIDELIANTEGDPMGLQDAILAIDGVDSPEVKLAISTALGFYRIYWAEHVTGPIQEDIIALTLLTAFRDGLALGAQ